MATITATGNFLARPNRASAPGMVVDYHFHNFDHTALPLSGLWRVTQYAYVEGETQPDPANFIAETLMAPHLFAPPGVDVAPWALIEKGIWHRVELVSKTMYVGGQEIEAAECEFWCCFSLRDYTGSVVEFQTGWLRAFA